MSDTGREAVLRPLRDRIDSLDDQLVMLLAERLRIVDEVIRVKQAHGLAARLDDRVEEVVARVRDRAEHLGAPPDLAEAVWRCMIDWVIAYEDQGLAGAPSKKPVSRLPNPPC